MTTLDRAYEEKLAEMLKIYGVAAVLKCIVKHSHLVQHYQISDEQFGAPNGFSLTFKPLE